MNNACPAEVFAGRRALDLATLKEHFARGPKARVAALVEWIQENKSTSFGQAHSFDKIKTLNDYRRAVQVTSYEDFRPWIMQAAQKKEVLTVDPVVQFFGTSGTTGAPKLVPVTKRYLEEVLYPHLRIRLGHSFEKWPDILPQPDGVINLIYGGPPPHLPRIGGFHAQFMSQAVSPTNEESELYGAPGTQAPWFTGRRSSDDRAMFGYRRLRHALEGNIRAIMAMSPIGALSLILNLEKNAEKFLRDLRDGTTAGEKTGSPNPARALAVEKTLKMQGPMLSSLWPRLNFISCWKSAGCAQLLPALERLIDSHCEIAPVYHIASEAVFTVPRDHHPTAGHLAADAGFFEFRKSEDDECLWCDELEVGSTYEIIVTNFNGFYRYTVGDLVKVLDYQDGWPRLDFVGRKGDVNDFAGEKIGDSSIREAAQRVFTDLNMRVPPLACSPDSRGKVPCYWIYVEVAKHLAPEIKNRFQTELVRYNPVYEAMCNNGWLKPVDIVCLEPGTLARFWLAESSQTARPQAHIKQRIMLPISVTEQLPKFSSPA